jgi:hypothetical protein
MAESESPGEKDPRTVFVADTAKTAEAVVQMLAAEGIAAEVILPEPVMNTEVITGLTEVTSPKEFPVIVSDPTKVDAAKEALVSMAEKMAAVKAIQERRASRTGTVTVVCEECGKSSDWDAKLMGTTEYCPHCQGYIDIPDPDDDWSDVDFGEPEEEVAEEETKE